MNKASVLFAVAAMVSAVPALATSSVTIVADKCVSVLEADGGCTFDGNDNDVSAIKAAYDFSGKAGAPLSLNPIAKFDPGSNSFEFGMGSVTDDGDLISGTWSIPGFVVDFVSLKAGNNFTLFKLTTPSSSGLWENVAITNRNGRPQAMSHLVFFGSAGNPGGPGAVPEPASWAMLIAGFGLVGASMRRRRGVVEA